MQWNPRSLRKYLDTEEKLSTKYEPTFFLAHISNYAKSSLRPNHLLFNQVTFQIALVATSTMNKDYFICQYM